MYVAVLVIPVPETKMHAYREWAEMSAGIFKKYGCLEIVDSWDDFVPRGKQTDFYRSVNARPGEKIVVSWQIWPDRESFFASEAKMHEDDALEYSGEVPFDPTRLISGCFQPIYSLGRE